MIGQTLLNYRITERLGAGGQGTVYKAVDTTLERAVVLKVLSPELVAKRANVRRFEREAKLASSLDHPNICTIYGLHEAGELIFIAMQFIEGRNVRQLVDGRALEVHSALSIAIQVADALAAAHERDIIHRDIKAGNVIVNREGRAYVLDFGLAKLLDTGARSDPHGTELTEIGVPYGTATYAAPEQAQGLPTDHRADIFSTGVLLYELLTGTWPFRGKTNIDVRYSVLHDAPPPVAAARSGFTPPSLQPILDRALQKNPGDRYQKIAEMRDHLRMSLREVNPDGSMSEAFIGTVLSPVVVPHHESKFIKAAYSMRGWWRTLTGAPNDSITPTFASSVSSTSTSIAPQTAASATPAPDVQSAVPASDSSSSAVNSIAQQSIAILPFRNLSGDVSVNFYQFSLADAVITELARLRRSLVVRPSTLIAKYQNSERDPREIGRELSVDSILAASFIRAGERFRVTAQLLDVHSDHILWSDRIDATATDIITLQDTIARHVVDGLYLEVDTSAQSAPRRLTTNAAAYEEYLRGRDRLASYISQTLSRDDMTAAIKHFNRAIELDSSFAPAHSGLGAAHATRVIKGFGDKQDYEQAERELNRALTLDPQLVEARLAMVHILLARGEKIQGRAQIERLVREAPNDATVHRVAATIYRLDGAYQAALESFERAAQLNPAERVAASYNRARIFMRQSRFDEAERALDEGSRIEPGHPLIKTFHAFRFYYEGDVSRAINLLRELFDLHPEMVGMRPLMAWCLSKQGLHEQARAELTSEVLASAAVDHDIAYWVASAYALEGESDTAFKWLEQAIKLGNEDRQWFERDPNWTEFREDERFQALMKNLKK